MEFRLLGPLEVSESGRARPIGGPKQRTVLVHLILRANHVVPPERLIEQIWGIDPPPAARSTLRGYVSHLRKALAPDGLEHRSGGYVLLADPSSIDAVRFEVLVAEARAAAADDPAAAARGFASALELWRGPALDDLADQPSLQPEIARLEELRLAATEERLGAELGLGRHRELIPELETLVGSYPFRERLWAHLMTALYRSGRQADALAAFHRARDLLSEELGIDPSRELRTLQERILRQDPSLDAGGEPLRGYRLLEQVGAGSFGAVHRAFQPQVGREVAIKTIHARFANDPEFIRRFEAEAQLIARLEHPHVVPMYDFWREPSGAYLVMRYLRGGSLRERLAHGIFPPDDAARLLDQVSLALEAAHRQGVVHRDVKPANILFDEDDNAYLTDFGIARDLEVADATSKDSTPSPLAYYLSPEEVGGEAVTPRTDIYSLGVVLFEMLAGRHPFADAAPDEVVARHLTSPLPPVSRSHPGLPTAIDDVITRATAKDPTERFPGAIALASAFRAALAPTARRPALVGIEIRNPYKGLRPFLEPDAPDFFGREAILAEILARLSDRGVGSRFLAVVGPSGSGKSSLVRAGLLPALRRGALPGSERWFIADMHPGAHPFEELASALTRIAVNPPVDLVDLLEQGDDGLGMTTSSLLPPETELVLVIDQFEELFTLLEDDDARTRFLAALRRAATDPESRLRVLVTLRADFYDRPLTYAGLAELMKARSVVVTPLVPEELERAAAGPAEGVGVRIESAVIADIVAEVTAQPGALPLLQYALTEMFERRDGASLTSEAYREIGGVSAALPRRAENLYRRMNQAGQAAARQLFLRLITLGSDGSKDARRRVLRSELASLLDVEAEAVDAVIETFGTRRLLSFDHDPVTRGPTVEVAHEALLREWDRLRGWVEGAREDVRAHRRLSAAAREWTDSGRDLGFLLRGSRLDRYEAWTSSSGLALTTDERAHLDASLAQRTAELADEEARRAREAKLERRSARRLSALVAVFAAAALIAASLTVVATNQRREAEREARDATARELAAASVANLEVDPELSILLAIEAVETTRSADGSVLPEPEEALHRAVTTSRLDLEVQGLGGLLAWSPRGVFVTEGPEGSGLIDIRDSETGERVRSFEGHDGDVNDVAFSPDGSLLASTGKDGRLTVWDPSTGQLLTSLLRDGGAWGPSFSADGSLVAAVWGAADSAEVGIFEPSSDQVVSWITVPHAIDTALSPDGEKVAVATTWAPDEGAGAGAVFDVATGEEAITFAGTNICCPSPRSRGVSWSPDGQLVAVSAEDTARVWDTETGALRYSLRGHSGLVFSVAWSPDSSRLVTGSADGTAKVWEIDSEGVREQWSLSAQETRSGIVGVAFSPDGTRVMAGDADISAVKVWNLGPSGDAEWANFPAAGKPAAEFMPDGRRIVTTSAEGADQESGLAVTIWDLKGSDLRTIGPPADFLRFLAFDVSPDGGAIALGGRSMPDCCGGASAVRAWNPSTREELYRIGHSLDVNEVAFSPDGEYLATASWDGTAKIVDRSGRVIQVLGEPSDGQFNFSDVAFSFDGRLVATAQAIYARRERVMIWDWARGELVLTIDADSDFDFPQVDFDPTGPRIVLTGSEGLAEVWDVESGERLAVLARPSGGAKDLAFSPDGSRIAIATVDGSVRLFDADTGSPQPGLPGSGCAVEGVAFSPDGRKLASSSRCDGVQIWALDIDDLLEIARREAGRSLTDEECRQYLHVDRCPRL
jgi:WD40 repeat protein/DNA-binding SARP family transcriptional activator